MRRRCAVFFFKLLLVSNGDAVGAVVVLFDGGPESAENSANIE